MAKLHYRELPSEGEKISFSKYLAEDEDLVLATGLGKTYLRSVFITALAWPGIIPLILGVGIAYLFGFDLFIGAGIGFLLDLLISFLKTTITHHSNRYLLTTRRVIIKKGYFAVQVTSALYDKITHIEVDQPFLDKVIMHHGKIIINTAGMNKGEIVLHYVDYPMEFKNLLERLINRERELLGQRSGPVVTLEGEIV